MDADAVVRAIGGLTLVGRMPGGEGVGAYEVRTDDGTRAVLKFAEPGHLDFARAGRTAAVLRARGYPAPSSLGTGSAASVVYGLSELLPGVALATPTASSVRQLVGLVDLQRGAGLRGREPWRTDIVTSVTDGRTGYCEHAAMTAYSPSTRALLDRVRRVAAAAGDVDAPDGDIVHMDLSPFNVLADERSGAITGVVDWEGSTCGDAAFDLVTHALYTYDSERRDALLDAARARTDPRVLPLYAAHMVLRQVDWSIRFHGEPEAQWFLDIGTALLDAVDAG